MPGALEYRSVTSDINASILAIRLRALFVFMTTPFSHGDRRHHCRSLGTHLCYGASAPSLPSIHLWALAGSIMESVLGFYTFVCQLFQLQAKVLQLFLQFRQVFWRRTCF